MIVQSSGKKILGRPEDSVKEQDDMREEAREPGLFAKEFGQGLRQQRVTDKTGERKGWKSPSGPKNDPKSSKTKLLLTC